MKLYLRTRSTAHDYRFLGQQPGERWWTAYKGVISFSEFSLVAERGDQGWRLFLGGIPSSRRDFSGTPVQYSLVAEGIPGENAARVLFACCSMALDAVSDPPNLLREALDNAFPRNIVDSLDAKSTAEQMPVVREQLRIFMDALKFCLPLSGKAENLMECPRRHEAYILSPHSLDVLRQTLASALLREDAEAVRIVRGNLEIDEAQGKAIWNERSDIPCLLAFPGDAAACPEGPVFFEKLPFPDDACIVQSIHQTTDSPMPPNPDAGSILSRIPLPDAFGKMCRTCRDWVRAVLKKKDTLMANRHSPSDEKKRHTRFDPKDSPKQFSGPEKGYYFAFEELQKMQAPLFFMKNTHLNIHDYSVWGHPMLVIHCDDRLKVHYVSGTDRKNVLGNTKYGWAFTFVVQPDETNGLVKETAFKCLRQRMSYRRLYRDLLIGHLNENDVHRLNTFVVTEVVKHSEEVVKNV